MWSLLLACAEPPAAPAERPELWPTEAVDPLPPVPGLEDLAGLDDTSLWRWAGDPAEGRATRGSWGLGDGRVFGLVGLDGPPSTLTNLVGPGYQRTEGFYGDVRVDVGALDPLAGRVERVRGTQAVRTWADHGDYVVQTVDVLGDDALVRHLAVTAAVAVDALPVTPSIAGSAGLTQSRNGHTLAVACDDAALGPLAAGESAWTTCRLTFDHARAEAFRDAWARSTAADAAWLEGAARPELPDPKVEDLYEGLLLTLRAQTTPEGVVSPLSRYTSAWLRDTEGAVRLLLAAGRFEDAARAQAGVYDLAVAHRAIANSYSLDAPVPGATPDWSTVPFMDGREPAEAPSYPVILDGLVRRAWGRPAIDDADFLRACVERQARADGLLPFSGDETFRWSMAAVLGDLPESLGWSANSAFLWIAAARELEGDDAEVMAATDGAYWTGEAWSPLAAYDTLEPWPLPYEEVSPQAARLGLSDAGLDALVEALLQPDGTLLSPGAVGYTGLVPGLALDALADRPEAEAVFDGVELVATPSGHFEELHGVDHLPLDLVHQPDGLGADVTARFRPWEGGVVGAALVHYLVGAEPDAEAGTLRVDPHLPNRWPEAAWRGLRMGDDRYDLVVTRAGDGLRVRLCREGGAGDWEVTVGGETRTLPPGGEATWEL